MITKSRGYYLAYKKYIKEQQQITLITLICTIKKYENKVIFCGALVT
jgi:hypothetical protein